MFEVSNTGIINREEPDGRAVLGTHVGNCSTVGDGQVGDTRAEELHKLPDNTDLSQVLKQDSVRLVLNQSR